MTLQAQYDQAVAAHRRGDLGEAERLYRRVLAAAPSSFAAHHMLGVLRAQSGDAAEALELIGAALTLKPDAPEALFNYGNVLKNGGRLDEALAAYERALSIRPGYAVARAARAETLNSLGNRLRDAGRFENALSCYEQALADAPHYPDALNNRAVALWSLNRFDAALAGLDAALAMKPDYVEAHYNRGNVLRDMLRLDEAMQSFDRAIAIDPAFAPAHRNKGFCTLLQGDFAQGLPLYEWRKRLSPPIEARSYPQPLWTGAEDIQGKTLFVYIEQGLGDTIQFYRFVAPLLERGAHVILSVQDPLLRLLENASPPVELVSSKTVPAAFDYHIPLMSLPLALGVTVASIPASVPYLKAESERAARWRTRIGEKGFKIGISWQGARGGVTSRAMPLRYFQGLSRLPGVRLISLQKGFGTEQLADLPGVESLGEDFDSGPDGLLDSAAVMQSLDLTITLDSALAHLAGALGRPVWVALKRVPDWRWLLGRADSPWYPGMVLFRQKMEADWAGVFAEMESQVRR
ncbi:MAG TPA: tetratricopeptide repeat-containing glycosyltransferase family protein [Rhizomicrobium sp.]|nr:tetratricopeptide repeat-containing glycosyltransferase family protein [Rhizomicrobium sp.]